MDTFLIRAWLVPALMLLAVDHNWWPGKFKKNGKPIPAEYKWLEQIIASGASKTKDRSKTNPALELQTRLVTIPPRTTCVVAFCA